MLQCTKCLRMLSSAHFSNPAKPVCSACKRLEKEAKQAEMEAKRLKVKARQEAMHATKLKAAKRAEINTLIERASNYSSPPVSRHARRALESMRKQREAYERKVAEIGDKLT